MLFLVCSALATLRAVLQATCKPASTKHGRVNCLVVHVLMLV